MFPLTPMMLLLGMFYFYTCIRPKFFKKLEEKDYAAHKQRIGNHSICVFFLAGYEPVYVIIYANIFYDESDLKKKSTY